MEQNNQLKAIGAFLKELRFSYGCTQDELASEINITKRTIQRIEGGENITIKSLIEILNWFEVDLIYNHSI